MKCALTFSMRYGKLNTQLNRCLVMLFAGMAAFAALAASAEPELSVTPDKQPARPNRAYRVTYEVSWEGDPNQYAVLPAEIDSIDWGGVNLSETRATVRGGVNIISQTIEVTPRESGDLEMPGVRIAYLSPENLAPPEKPGPPTHPTAPDASPQLRAEPFALQVRPDRTLTWLLGALGALFMSFLTVWVVRRRRTRSLVLATAAGSAASGTAVDLAAAESALQSARQRRMDGNYYEFYLGLARAAASLGSGAQEQAAQLNANAQHIGYRGTRPTDDQMDADIRALERHINRYKEEAQP